MNSLSFTVNTKPQPQGSMAYWKGNLCSDNMNLKAFRNIVAWEAKIASKGFFATKHAPVRLEMDFYFERPRSAPNRLMPSVKPDLDKLCRACCDAGTGVLWVDDGQVCELIARKHYGSPARVEITVRMAATSYPE